MKKQGIKMAVILGGLCGSLLFSSASHGMVGEEILRGAPVQITREEKMEHWSTPYVNKLNDSSIESLAKGEDLDAAISLEELKELFKKALGADTEGLDINTREEVVAYLVEVWADQTGNNLDEMAIPMMLVYSDTTEIQEEYNHKVMIGYFQGIAQGRPDGLFYPKDIVTYGEAATLVHNMKNAIAAERKAEETERGATDLKVAVDYEINEEAVTFHIELNNEGEEAQEIMFSSGQQYELHITNEKGEEVYRFSDDKFFTLALINKTLEPGETLQWKDQWDLTDKEGQKLTEGSFRATFEILGNVEDGKMDLEKVVDFQL